MFTGMLKAWILSLSCGKNQRYTVPSADDTNQREEQWETIRMMRGELLDPPCASCLLLTRRKATVNIQFTPILKNDSFRDSATLPNYGTVRYSAKHRLQIL